MEEKYRIAEREGLVEMIRETFGPVSLGEGITWSESEKLDLFFESQDALKKARVHKFDRHWTALVDDESWSPEAGIGGWAFLDSEACAYYLPAGMIRCIRSGYDVGLAFFLTPGPEHEQENWARFISHWTKLTLAQRQCVAEFLRYMARVDYISSSDWTVPLDRYWAQFV